MPYTAMQLAEAFLKTGELEDALEALNQQLADHPQDDDALRMRAALYLRLPQDRLQAALRDLQAIRHVNSEDAIHESVLHERMGDPEAAIHSLESALQRHAQDERLSERLIGLYHRHGRLAEALALVRQQPRVWRWLQWEGDLLAASGDDVSASARYNLALAQLDQGAGGPQQDYLQAIRARLQIACGHSYRRQGQTDMAQRYYEAAQALLPDDPGIGFNLGLLQAMNGHLPEAQRICQSALDASPALHKAALLEALNAPEFAELRQALAL